jgi:serine protease Do
VLAGIAAGVVLLGGIGAGIAIALGGDDGGKEKKESAKLTQEEIVERVAQSTVRIRTRDSNGDVGGGSGVVLDAAEGLIITNSHVVNGTRSRLVIYGDPLVRVEARIVGQSPCEDVAVLKMDEPPKGMKPLTPVKGAPKLGEKVTAYGFPDSAQGGAKASPSFGTVTAPDVASQPLLNAPRLRSVVGHDASLNPGNSGGPLVNSKAELLGINTFGFGTGQQYSISASRVLELAEQLKKGSTADDVGWDLVPNEGRDELGYDNAWVRGGGDPWVPQRDGLLNLALPPTNSPAREKVFAGDTILRINDQPMDSIQDVCSLLRSEGPGANLDVDMVDKDGDELKPQRIKLRGAA